MLAELRERRILIDGAPTQGQGLLLQIFTQNVVGPCFFEIIQRKGNEGFGEGNFKALFESLELDQIRRGVLSLDEWRSPRGPECLDRSTEPASAITSSTRSAARRAARAELAAALSLWPVCRAALGHRLHRAAREQPAHAGCIASGRASCTRTVRAAGRIASASRRSSRCLTSPNQLRWDPLPMPDPPDRLPRRPDHLWRQRRAASSRRLRHSSLCRQPVDDATARFYDADGELLIVPQQGRLLLIDRARAHRASSRRRSR